MALDRELYYGFLIFLPIVCLVGNGAAGNGAAVTDEKRLIRHLLQNYESVGVLGRPVYTTSETLRVKYGMALIQLMDLDEKNQVLTTNVWSRYQWNDILLKWDPEDFGGIDLVRVPAYKIWTPDIVLYNYADTRLQENKDALAVVTHDGSVLWIPMATFKSTCSIDITHFPYDEQQCQMRFASWTYDGFKMDVDFYDGLEAVDVNDYIESNEWALVDHSAVKNVKYYPCCAEPYPDLVFTLRIKRIAAFYNYMIILPSVLLSLLTLVIFWLPPESPDKMMLAICTFVAFFILLLVLAEVTPPAASSIPLIGAYFCINMVLITLSAFLSVIVINLNMRGGKKKRVPTWLRKVSMALAWVMCIAVDADNSTPRTDHHPMTETSDSASPNKKAGCMEADCLIDLTAEESTKGQDLSESPVQNQVIQQGMKEIQEILQKYVDRLEQKDTQDKIAKEWRVVASVLDRIFFIMYVCAIAVAMAKIFPKA